MGLDIIDVLRVVREELALVLQHGDESMSRCESLGLGQNILGNGEEDGRILLKDLNVEHLLGIVQAQVLELGIQTGASGAEIRDAQRRGYARTSENDDVSGLFEQLDGVVDRIVLRQLRPLRELPADSQNQKTAVSTVILTVETIGRAHAKGCKEFFGGDDAHVNSATAKLIGTKSAKLVAVRDGLVRSAEVGVYLVEMERID